MDERERINKYFLKKRIFALIFLIVIFSFSGINFLKSYQPIEEEIIEKLNVEKYAPSETVALIEATINENLLGRVNFIETYGFIQVLLDKKECNNFTYIKDEEGYLHYATFYRDADSQLFNYAVVRQIKSTTIRHFILTGIAEKRSNKAYYKHLIRQIK